MIGYIMLSLLLSTLSRRSKQEPIQPFSLFWIIIILCFIVVHETFAFTTFSFHIIINDRAKQYKKKSLALSNRLWNTINNSNNDNNNINEHHKNVNANPHTIVSDVTHLSHIERVYCISDLHTDNTDNMSWLQNQVKQNVHDIGIHDLIVVAGDISHHLDTLETSLSLLKTGLNCEVLFVNGNHEAWITSKESYNSLEKFEAIQQLCHKLGILTGCVMVGGEEKQQQQRQRQQNLNDNQETIDNNNNNNNNDDYNNFLQNPIMWIVPLQSWYDSTLSISNCEDLCIDFPKWPWVDFIRCNWPTNKFPPMGNNNGKIPKGLVEYFLQLNQETIIKQFQKSIQEYYIDKNKNDKRNNYSSITTVMTVSHFLPNLQSLPDWKDLTTTEFQRPDWFDHGAGQVSAKFAKVAGTKLLDDQIRSIQDNYSMIIDNNNNNNNNQNPIKRHLHVFGHSHRPKDFEYQNIRYIHNPLGKPRERDLYMISPNVTFQLVWDYHAGGEVLGEPIIRYWEEQGGGLVALQQRMQQMQPSRYHKRLQRRLRRQQEREEKLQQQQQQQQEQQQEQPQEQQRHEEEEIRKSR